MITLRAEVLTADGCRVIFNVYHCFLFFSKSFLFPFVKIWPLKVLLISRRTKYRERDE